MYRKNKHSVQHPPVTQRFKSAPLIRVKSWFESTQEDHVIGESTSGKSPVSEAGIHWFESNLPSQAHWRSGLTQ